MARLYELLVSVCDPAGNRIYTQNLYEDYTIAALAPDITAAKKDFFGGKWDSLANHSIGEFLSLDIDTRDRTTLSLLWVEAVAERKLQYSGLREVLEECKQLYLDRCGKLDWQFYDEGLLWAVQDYYSSTGSLRDFTADDWKAAAEFQLSPKDVADLCRQVDDEFDEGGIPT